MLLSTQTNSDLLIDESLDPIKLAIVIKSYLPIIKKADQMLEYIYSQNIDKSKIVELKNWLEQIRDNIQKTYGDFFSEEYTKYLKELNNKIQSFNNAIERTERSSTLSFTTIQDQEIQTDTDYKEQAMSKNILQQQKIIETLRQENSALKEENSALKEENSALREKNSTPKGENLAKPNVANLLDKPPVILSSSPLSVNLIPTDAQQNPSSLLPQSSNENKSPPNQSSNATTAGISVTASLVVVSNQNNFTAQRIRADSSPSRSDIQNPDIQDSKPGCFSILKLKGRQFCGYLAK